MTTDNMNRVELTENELDAVNGGFGLDDIVNAGKKITNGVKKVVEKEVNKVVDTVVDIVKDTIRVTKDAFDGPASPEPMPVFPVFPTPVKPIIM